MLVSITNFAEGIPILATLQFVSEMKAQREKLLSTSDSGVLAISGDSSIRTLSQAVMGLQNAVLARCKDMQITSDGIAWPLISDAPVMGPQSVDDIIAVDLWLRKYLPALFDIHVIASNPVMTNEVRNYS